MIFGRQKYNHVSYRGRTRSDSILVSLGYNVVPWRDLSEKDRNWILFSEDQSQVPVYAGFAPAESRDAIKRKLEPSYMGTFTGAKRHVFTTFTGTIAAK